MRTLYLTMLLFMGMTSYAQGNGGVEISIDAENGSKVYRGDVTFYDLTGEKTFDWFQKGVDAYKPDTAAIKYLQKHLAAYKLVIAMGTWCSDSHDMIPRLYKVMQLCNYPMSNYYMFGVNRKKESLNAESKLYNITKAPTIIIYRGNTELGRITETVQTSVEGDLQAIIAADNTPVK
jgi:hypothetical protein